MVIFLIGVCKLILCLLVIYSGDVRSQASCTAEDSCRLKVLHCWQRIVDGQWVIGTVVKNELKW